MNNLFQSVVDHQHQKQTRKTDMEFLMDMMQPKDKQGNPIELLPKKQPPKETWTPSVPPKQHVNDEKKTSDKVIFDEEVATTEELDDFEEDASDARERPEYDISYQQTVTSSDVFLGLNFSEKNPGTTTAEQMRIRIECPKLAGLQQVNLDVTRTRLLFSDPVHYRLYIALPDPIVEAKGDAKWIAKKRQLVITAPLDKNHINM